MLTNFQTILARVKKMQDYERMLAAGDFDNMPKKEALMHSRELEKLHRNLGGIRAMNRLPDAVFIIDTKKEHLAVTEANKLGIPVVAVVDTNCDPDIIDFVIPGNDDAIRAGNLMCRVMADAIKEGQFIASRRYGRQEVAAAPAALTPEQEAARAEQQAEARRQAALEAREREARIAAARESEAREAPAASEPAPAPAAETAAPEAAPEPSSTEEPTPATTSEEQ